MSTTWQKSGHHHRHPSAPPKPTRRRRLRSASGEAEGRHPVVLLAYPRFAVEEVKLLGLFNTELLFCLR